MAWPTHLTSNHGMADPLDVKPWHGRQVVEAIGRDPEAVLRLVLPRIRHKEREWRQARTHALSLSSRIRHKEREWRQARTHALPPEGRASLSLSLSSRIRRKEGEREREGPRPRLRVALGWAARERMEACGNTP